MRRPVGITLLSVFFAFGALMASLASLGLLFPGGPIEPMWRLNPRAQVRLLELGWSGVVLMGAIASACALAAIGLWIRARWGHRLALAILAVNVLGDLLNAVLLRDLRTLIGVPIGAAMLWYLVHSRTRAQFETRPAES